MRAGGEIVARVILPSRAAKKADEAVDEHIADWIDQEDPRRLLKPGYQRERCVGGTPNRPWQPVLLR